MSGAGVPRKQMLLPKLSSDLLAHGPDPSQFRIPAVCHTPKFAASHNSLF